MKFAKVYLVRHGEFKNPKKIIPGFLPLPLTPRGKTQARRAAKSLKPKNIGVIISSPQKRALETAKIINQAGFKNKLKIQIDKNLRESEFAHKTQGLTRFEIAQKFPKEMKIYRRFPAKMKKGETLANMAQRMMAAIQKGVKKNPGKSIVFISHRDPILAALLKISGRNFNELQNVKGACTLCSISEIWCVGKRMVNKTF